jgi:DNA polymerase elongation subunit (family B)
LANSAWNGGGFDYPYLINRSKKLFGNADGMSNYGSVKLTEKTSETGKLVYKVSSYGHHFLDLLDVYKTFVYKARSSYSLDNIAFVELKERKVPHTEYAAFDDFYTGKYVIPTNPTEHQKNSKIYNHAIKYGVDDEVRELSYSEFVYYGAKDTYLIKRIDDKLKFTSLLTMIADKMGVVISDTMSTVKPWSNYLGNRAMVNKKVMPPNKQKDASPNIVGGFVRDPQVGKHKWVLSCDVNSMYPLLGMVGFNNSPETFVSKSDLPPDLRSIILTYFNNQNEAERLYMDESIWNHTTELLKKYNYSLGINGAIFDKSELGMIPELVQEIYNTRKDYKKTMFKYETRALLIEDILNERNSK